ncbi:Lrp/AsnC family transcriptional regulator [Candidatus Woesearchaeota archaeon]|nr:Lrp/AsnC family transcriptional regulator [Candidatus Woesearchaeota archaeon]
MVKKLEREKLILQKIREDSRKNLTKISEETKIPKTTVFDILRRLENNVIKKHTSLVDFTKLGYGLKVNFVLRSKDKKQMKDFLMNHSSINNLHSLINDYDFFAECIFKDLNDLESFKEELNKNGLSDIEHYFIVEDLKKEGFEL